MLFDYAPFIDEIVSLSRRHRALHPELRPEDCRVCSTLNVATAEAVIEWVELLEVPGLERTAGDNAPA